MAITLDAADGFSEANPDTVHTLTGFTVANQADRFFLGGVGIDSSFDNVSSVTFNGDALTQNAGASISEAGFATAQWWSRVSPDIATGDYEATMGSSNRCALFAVSLYGVDTADPFRDQDEAAGNTGTSSQLTLTTVAGDLVLSMIFLRNETSDPGNLVPDDGTEIEELHPVSNNANIRSSALSKVAVGVSTAVGWSWTNATTPFAHVAVVIKPAAASGLRLLTTVGAGV